MKIPKPVQVTLPVKQLLKEQESKREARQIHSDLKKLKDLEDYTFSMLTNIRMQRKELEDRFRQSLQHLVFE